MIEFPPVLTKRDFVRRYSAGEFGNRSPTWETIEEALNSGLPGEQLIHIRNRIAGGRTWYDIPLKYLSDVHRGEVLASGLAPSQLYFSAMAPTASTILQGEVMQSEDSLELFFTTVAKPMRAALAENAHRARGIIALETLRHYLCSLSFDWMQTLLERYPGHVIEFSTYAQRFGTLPNYNSIIWEVRMY